MPDELPRRVYRFFREEWQADALVQGQVFISTLETCRAYENPKQGDALEAVHIYDTTPAFSMEDHPNAREIAARAGIHVNEDSSGGIIRHNLGSRHLPDAYVLCTTTGFVPEKLSETFGKYVVEIRKPRHFLNRVTRELQMHASIEQWMLGSVIYRERLFTGAENEPGPLGFIKPPDLYSEQEEFRFLWIPNGNATLTPIPLTVPSASTLCRRLA